MNETMSLNLLEYDLLESLETGVDYPVLPVNRLLAVIIAVLFWEFVYKSISISFGCNWNISMIVVGLSHAITEVIVVSMIVIYNHSLLQPMSLVHHYVYIYILDLLIRYNILVL